jgi:hypothetical protein
LVLIREGAQTQKVFLEIAELRRKKRTTFAEDSGLVVAGDALQSMQKLMLEEKRLLIKAQLLTGQRIKIDSEGKIEVPPGKLAGGYVPSWWERQSTRVDYLRRTIGVSDLLLALIIVVITAAFVLWH